MGQDILRYLWETHQIELNEQQRQGVLSSGQNTLLLAVPGSGKTTVLVTRIANLMENHHVERTQILTLTYNRETAKDMKTRFCHLFGSIIENPPHFATIHSFCLSVMKYYARALNRPMPAILSQDTDANLKSRALREIYRRYNDEFLTEDTYDTLEKLIAYAKNMLLTQTELEKGKYEIQNFHMIFADYEAFKRKNRLIDFDDMLTLTLDILMRFDKICAHFQAQYRYINVDEAQDTSLVQHKIIELLAQKSIVFMVGDEDQSIYSFRGAYPKALLEFSQHYADGVIIKMEQNFRSNRDIVLQANAFIKQNKQRYQKEMYCDNDQTGSIEWVQLADYADQPKAALEYIMGYPPHQTLAVVYKNNESAIPLVNLFYQHGIRFYCKEHRVTFFSSAVMRDIVAYLRLAIDSSDLEAFAQIYYKLGYSKGVFEFVKDNIAYYDGVFDTILRVTSLSDYKRFQTREFILSFPRLLRKSPAGAIEFIQTDLNYDSYIENRMQDGFTKTSTYQKLNTAKALGVGLKDCYEFLDKISALALDMQQGRNISRESNITLTTLHSSKGLEFDTVLMLDMVRDILPSSDAVNDKLLGDLAAYENETRLFYVGMTRAKSKLVFYRSHLINGAITTPSIYLNQLMQGGQTKMI